MTRAALHLEEARVGERAIDTIDVDARAAVDALHADDERLLADDPPALFAARVRAHANEAMRRRRRTRFVGSLAPVAAIACAALFLIVRQDKSDDVRAKGGPQLMLERLVIDGGSARVDRLRDTDRVRAGDRVQLVVLAGDAKEAAIVSIDGRGDVTLHFPLNARSPSVDGRFQVPDAVILDDAPDFERFFLVTGAHVDVDAVVAAARSIARSQDRRTAPLPVSLSQTSITLLKEP